MGYFTFVPKEHYEARKWLAVTRSPLYVIIKTSSKIAAKRILNKYYEPDASNVYKLLEDSVNTNGPQINDLKLEEAVKYLKKGSCYEDFIDIIIHHASKEIEHISFETNKSIDIFPSTGYNRPLEGWPLPSCSLEEE